VSFNWTYLLAVIQTVLTFVVESSIILSNSNGIERNSDTVENREGQRPNQSKVRVFYWKLVDCVEILYRGNNQCNIYKKSASLFEGDKGRQGGPL